MDCIISFMIAYSTQWHINSEEDEINWARDIASKNIDLTELEYWTAMYLSNDLILTALLKSHKTTYIEYENLDTDPINVVKYISEILDVRHAERLKVPIPLRMRDKSDVYGTLRSSISRIITENRERLASIVLRHVIAASGLDMGGVRDVLGVNSEDLAGGIEQLLL